MIYVQFTDETKTEICSVFSCHQDDEVYPNQGLVEETDERYVTFIEKTKGQLNG